MSNTQNMQAFLTGKSFVIPAFQRDYAWTIDEVKDLFDDVQEAQETKVSHYLGTIVLAKPKSPFAIVDGQQRLTTLMLMIHAFLAQLDPSDPFRIADDLYLLKDKGSPKLDFGVNQSFMADIFSGINPKPTTRGQRLLAEAYKYCRERAQGIHDSNADAIRVWLDTIKNLEIIPFFEADAGRAIRIFQSVNDRGRDLTNMDKTKALLILYSSLYLDGALDARINESFGACFAAYDRLREKASETGYNIDLINQTGFSEDDILRYHYLAYNHEKANDYQAYGKTILDLFLKPALKDLKDDPVALRAFITDYTQDLEDFTKTFANMVEAARSNKRLFTVLVMHGLAARLYPIAIRLYQRNLLFASVPSASPTVDLLHCLEVVDLRVYKIRGTEPAKDIGYLSHISRTATIIDIAALLHTFLINFGADTAMRPILERRMYQSGAVVPILLAFEQKSSGQQHTPEHLVELARERPSQEHILSQEPSFDPIKFGFVDKAEFEDNLHRIGNLTLLTSRENSRCGSKSVGLKLSQPDLYLASKFIGPRLLAQDFSNRNIMFNKEAVENRTNVLTQFALANWAIW